MINNLVRRSGVVDTWLEEDNLMLLECWSRDGYTIEDIANKIGVTKKTLYDWRSQYPEIDEALRKGREIVDYMVENALLKSALGFQTKEVKVTTVLRFGKVVETIKEVTNKEQAPNVNAIQTWLYNRSGGKWKNMNAKQNMFEDMEEDDSIEIVVKRATKNDSEEDDTEKEITLRKRSKEEQEAVEKQKKKEKKKADKEAKKHVEVIEDDEDVESDLDEWPEDWEDDDE